MSDLEAPVLDKSEATNIVNKNEKGVVPSRRFETNEIREQVKASMEEKLKPGCTFKTFAEFSSVFSTYALASFTHTFVRDSGPKIMDEKVKERFPVKKIYYTCKNRDAEVKNHGTGQRKNHHLNGTGCKFEIRASYIKKLDAFRVSKFEATHCNHDEDEYSYLVAAQGRQFSGEQLDQFVKRDVMTLKASKQKVVNQIYDETGKIVTVKDLANKVRQIQDKESEVESALQFYEKLHQLDPESSLKVFYCDETEQGMSTATNKIFKCLFWQNSKMKALLKQFGTVIFLDGTYNLLNNKYVLVLFLVIDHSNRSRIIAWAFINRENLVNYESVLMSLVEANPEEVIDSINFAVLDKSMAEISALAKVIPHVKFVICQFHALKAVKNRIKDFHFPPEHQIYKNTLNKLFEKMVYEPTLEGYNNAIDEIIAIGNISEALSEARGYIIDNWHENRNHFSIHILKKERIFLSYTNNRTENMNMQLKQIIKRRSSLLCVSQELCSLFESQYQKMQIDEWTRRNKKISTAFCDAYEIQMIQFCQGILSSEIVHKLLEQYKETSNISINDLTIEEGKTVCPRSVGICSFNTSMGLPCSHLLALRKHMEEILLTRDMIDSRWFSKIDENSMPLSVNRSIYKKLPTPKKRYLTADKVTSELKDSLSNFTGSEYQEKIKMLENISTSWKMNIPCNLLIDNLEQEHNHGVDNNDSVRLDPGDQDNCVDNGDISPTLNEASSLVSGEGNEVSIEERINLVFSPCKRNFSHTVGNSRPSYGNVTKRRKLSSKEKPKCDELTEGEQELVNFMRALKCDGTWYKQEFDIMKSTAFLTDAHFDYFNTLIIHQLKLDQGFQSTLLYETKGLEPVDYKKDFIQPLHSGGRHWIAVTNIGIPQERRHCEVKLYDSLIRVDNNGTDIIIPEAVCWQVSQLLRNGKSNFNYISVTKCMQQPNMYDCGMFAIANCLLLAHDNLPEDHLYTGNLRKQFMGMLNDKKLKLFDSIKPTTAAQKNKFRQKFLIGRLPQYIDIPEYKKEFSVVCDCKLPETFGNCIICDSCNSSFHSQCYLIGNKVASDLKMFRCYTCRNKLKDYTFCENPSNLALGSILSISEKINNMEKKTFVRHWPVATAIKNTVPETMLQYSVVEDIICKYDLNRIAGKRGPIYDSLENAYQLHKNSLISCPALFELVPVNQVTHLAIRVICDINKIDCPPVYSPKHEANFLSENGVKVFLKSHGCSWIKTLSTHFQTLKKKINNLINSKKPYVQSCNDISTYDRELIELSNAFKKISCLEKADDTLISPGLKVQKMDLLKSSNALLKQVKDMQAEFAFFLEKQKIN